MAGYPVPQAPEGLTIAEDAPVYVVRRFFEGLGTGQVEPIDAVEPLTDPRATALPIRTLREGSWAFRLHGQDVAINAQQGRADVELWFVDGTRGLVHAELTPDLVAFFGFFSNQYQKWHNQMFTPVEANSDAHDSVLKKVREIAAQLAPLCRPARDAEAPAPATLVEVPQSRPMTPRSRRFQKALARRNAKLAEQGITQPFLGGIRGPLGFLDVVPNPRDQEQE